MDYGKMVKIVKGRPWRTIEIRLDNGDVHAIRHPDHVTVRESLIVVWGDGDLQAIFEPQVVSSIHRIPMGGNGGRRSAR